MSPTGSHSSASAPAPARIGEDWAAATADTIERVVENVRSKTADPLQRVARLVVYGLLAAIVGVLMRVLILIAVVRGLVILLVLAWEPEVWVVYLVLGGIFSVAGLFLWKRANRPTAAKA